MRLVSAVAVIGMLFSGGVAMAADDAGQNVFKLGEVIISAERYPNITEQHVSSEDMRLFEKRDLADAVSLVPGVTVTNFGARNERIIYVRGLDVKHVPLYIDGVPVYVPYDGYVDFGRFTTFDISQIEVSKGFSSVLYGPNAMGGAINMVSRKPSKELEIDAGTTVGFDRNTSNNDYGAYANVGTNQGKWYVQASASYLRSDFYTLSNGFTPTNSAEDGGKRENSYLRDGKINMRAGLTPNSTDEYTINYINSQSEKGVPPYAGTDSATTVRYWRWPYWDKESVYFISKTNILADNYVKARVYYDKFKNSLNSYDNATYTTVTKPYAFLSNYDDHTIGASVELALQPIGRNSVKIAPMVKEDTHREVSSSNNNSWMEYKDQLSGVGVEDRITLTESLYTIIGAGYYAQEGKEAQDYKNKTVVDQPTKTATSFDPQIGLFKELGNDKTVFATVSGKTRFPTIKDRFSYRLGSAIPNPDLKPERSVNYEVGFKGQLNEKIRAETSVFYNDVSDYIQMVTIPDPSNPGKNTGQNQNVAKAEFIGVELSLKDKLSDILESGINYTYIEAKDKTHPDLRLTDIPRHNGMVYAKVTPVEPLSLLLDLTYNANRYSDTNGARATGDFTVVNAKAMYAFNKSISLEAGVNNLLDRNYQIAEGFPEAGVSYFANVRYKY